MPFHPSILRAGGAEEVRARDRSTTTTGETMDVVERRLIAGSIAPVGSLARLTRLRRPVRLPIRQHWSA
jgi:hypothetical protein